MTTTEGQLAASEASQDSELFRETNEVVINREPGEPDDKVDSKLTKEHGKFEFIFYVYEGNLFTCPIKISIFNNE